MYIFLTDDKVYKTENTNINFNVDYKSNFQIYIFDLIAKIDFTNTCLFRTS